MWRYAAGARFKKWCCKVLSSVVLTGEPRFCKHTVTCRERMLLFRRIPYVFIRQIQRSLVSICRSHVFSCRCLKHSDTLDFLWVFSHLVFLFFQFPDSHHEEIQFFFVKTWILLLSFSRKLPENLSSESWLTLFRLFQTTIAHKGAHPQNGKFWLCTCVYGHTRD